MFSTRLVRHQPCRAAALPSLATEKENWTWYYLTTLHGCLCHRMCNALVHFPLRGSRATASSWKSLVATTGYRRISSELLFHQWSYGWQRHGWQLKYPRATIVQGSEPAQTTYICLCSTESNLSVFDRVAANSIWLTMYRKVSMETQGWRICHPWRWGVALSSVEVSFQAHPQSVWVLPAVTEAMWMTTVTA